MSSLLPLQQISDSEKSEKWFRQNAEYFISQSFNFSNKSEIYELYNAIDGIINEDYYKHVHNPYNSDGPKWKNLPAKLKYFNIIEPVVMSMIGEKGREPDMIRIVCTNPDVNTEYLESLNDKVFKAAVADFNNQVSIISNGGNPNQVTDYTAVETDHKMKFKSRRTIQLDNAWDYMKENLRYRDIKQKYAFDYMVTGRAYTHKYVYMDEVYEEVVPPNEITIFTTPTSDFVSDAFAVVRWQELPISAILDRHRDHLDEETLKKLEQTVNGFSSEISDVDSQGRFNKPNLMSYQFNERYSHNMTIWHVQWKGKQQVQILTYDNPLGIEMEMEVDMQYKLNEAQGDKSLKVGWISHTHEYWRLGDRNYFGCTDPKKTIQQHSMSNVSKVKLGYDGIVNRGRSGKVNSIVKSGLPYQALYNIYKYRTEMVMAMNKDKIMILPKGLKPKNWKFDDWMYYIHVTRMAFIDETNENVTKVLQAIKEIDLSLGKYISDMIAVTEQIKNDWWDSVGFNRQRLGGVMASDGKANTQEAINRSSLVTSEYMRKLSSFEREDVNGLLNLSKYAWIKGKKKSFMRSNGELAMIDIEGQDYMENEYGIFTKNSASEVEKVDLLKSLLQPMAQNDMSKAIISEILDEDNFEKIKHLMYKADEIQRNFLQEQQKAANEATKYAADQSYKANAENNETKKYVADRNAESKIESARITATVAMLTGGSAGGGEDGDNDGIINEASNDIDKTRLMDTLNSSLDAYKANNQKNVLEYEKLKTDRMKITAKPKPSK